MKTEVSKLTFDSLAQARSIVRAGGVVAFGTETVYGLGADARNVGAVKAIFAAKGRPMDNPLIVHVARVSDIPSVCKIDGGMLEKLSKVMPAPLTVILPKSDGIPYEVTAGLDTVGVRVPASEGARTFIEVCGVPIAAPSANTSTRPSPTTAQHVYDDLNGKIPLILDMGACGVGVESTVVDLTRGEAKVLRLGGMTVERLKEIFGAVDVPEMKPTDQPLSPGMKYRHYAPKIPVRLLESGDTARAKEWYREALADGLRAVIMAMDGVLNEFQDYECASLGATDEDAARSLFACLRDSEQKFDIIITFRLPDAGYGKAVNNRLAKASSGV